MLIIYIQIIGCGFFFLSTIVLGIFLRKYTSEKARKTTTIFLHFIAFMAFLLPVLIGIFYPGLTAYDDLLGIQPLPYGPLRVAFGAILIPIGIFFVAVSNFALLDHGHGQAAFFLTKNVVNGYVYKLTRNPMSLGFYLGCLALGFLSGSTYFTLWILIEVIPAHIFYLRFFEEQELELRFGNSYMEYKKKVPFLFPNFRKGVKSTLDSFFII
jgi:protein-S-isoprenylcysteine O-methyltransferase Ste14